MSLYSADDLAKLRRPHVSRAWFGELFLPSGVARVHPGVGNFTIGGFEWRGISDPANERPRLVFIDAVQDPRFGQAVSVNIIISGANREFIREIHQNADAIEGVVANLYWCAFDAETAQPVLDLKKPFPGYLSAPVIEWDGPASRQVAFTIESIWLSQDDPFGGTWSYTGQKKRYPDDEGGEFIGVRVEERFN